MSKRKPAVSTQLKNALVEIEDLKKKLEAETRTKDSWYRQANERADEIEMVHTILDAIQGCPGRKTSVTEESWRSKDLTLSARLAAYFAMSRSGPF